MTDTQQQTGDSGQQSPPVMASIEKLRSELDRVIDYARDKGGQAFSAFGFGANRSWTPECDVLESAEEIIVRIDLPGVERSALDLSFTGNMLTVSGERRLPAPAPSDQVHLQERRAGKFSRSIPLPVAIDGDDVHAELLTGGILVVRLAKAQKAKPRQVPINVQEESATPV